MRAAGGSPRCYARIGAPVLFDGSVHTKNGLATVFAQDSCPSRFQGEDRKEEGRRATREDGEKRETNTATRFQSSTRTGPQHALKSDRAATRI